MKKMNNRRKNRSLLIEVEQQKVLKLLHVPQQQRKIHRNDEQHVEQPFEFFTKVTPVSFGFRSFDSIRFEFFGRFSNGITE